MGKAEYQKEEDQLLETALDKRFFSVWRSPYQHPLWLMSSMELYITSECNLACEYCYLQYKGDDLYPKEHRNKKTILENLDKVLDWWLSNDFHINELQLFSGEIWHLPYGDAVLDTILSYLEKGLKLCGITIPTNSSFAFTDEGVQHMQQYVDRFRKAGVHFVISHSIEGLFLEDVSRPMRSIGVARDQAFYERVFRFAKNNGYFFHPMVAAVNIEKWPENYDWFRDMCAKYDIKFPSSVMMLEVRNPDWTDEKLEYLKAYYTHQIEQIWGDCGNNYDRFLADVFGIGDSKEEKHGYSNIAIPMARAQAGCSIPTTLTVRVGDLAIVPCHRTAYPQYNYGKFIVEEGRITGIAANNTQMAVKVLYSDNLTSHHGCDVCAYNGVCLRGCFGEQHESVEDAFMPDPIVCRMLKTKYDHLIQTYKKMGLLSYMANIPSTDIRYIMCQQVLIQVDRILENGKEKN